MQVTVFGATGRLGRVVVPALVAAGHDVRAVVRGSEQLDAVAAQGARGVVVDLEDAQADLAPALDGAEAVVWAAGANVTTGPEHSDRIDRDGALRAIAAAEAAKVRRWLQVSSLYADRWQEGPDVLHHFLQNKAAADEALKGSSLGETVLRPGGLTDDEPTGRITVADRLDWGRITRGDVAAVVAALLATGAGVGRAFDLANGDTPVDEAVAAL